MSIRTYSELVGIRREELWNGAAGVSCVQGFRPSMEDAHVTAEVKETRLLAVFDGHGGSRVAELAAGVLKARVEEEWPVSRSQTLPPAAEAVRRALLRVEDELAAENASKKSIECTGSTAACLTIDAKHITSCWLGDTRAIIASQDNNGMPLSFDHKPNEAGERQRIFENGGTVFRGRVNGALAVSRALGDYCYKTKINPLVSSTPDCLTRQRQSNDEFLILACDGIWEKISNQQAVALIRAARLQAASPAELAAKLLRWALLAGSSDNISVIVYLLDTEKKSSSTTTIVTTSKDEAATLIEGLKDAGLSPGCLCANLILDLRRRTIAAYSEVQVISLFTQLGFASPQVLHSLAEHHLDGEALLETTQQEFIEDIQMTPLDAAFMATAVRWWEKTATWI